MPADPSSPPTPVAPEAVRRDGTNRRSFLRSSSGIATGAALATVPVALIVAAPADATSARPANGVPVKDPVGTPPTEPVMAYIHDAKAGTVVIMSGSTQRTVKDRELVRRLTVATKKKKPKRRPRRRSRRSTTKVGG